MKKIYSFVLLAGILGGYSLPSYAAVETVDCASNPVFSENSCNQCFNGGNVEIGDNKGLLSDIWENATSVTQYMYKEEQEMPQMIALNGAQWTEVKASSDVDFWQYTKELEDIYSKEDLAYKLDAGKSIKWLESTLGSAYELSSATSQGDLGLLVYTLAMHGTDNAGDVSLETTTHKECVLYSGGSAPEVPTNPEVPNTSKLPQTGPEHILLALVALALGLGFVKMRKSK